MSLLKGVIALGLAVVVSGCALVRTPATGTLFMDVKASESISSNELGSKMGTACATSILGWVATGDASTNTAAKNGGLTKISHVDYHTRSFLGLWGETCTQAYGS